MKRTIKDEIRDYVVDFHRKLKDCDILYNQNSTLYMDAKNELREKFKHNKELMRESIKLFGIEELEKTLNIKDKNKLKTPAKQLEYKARWRRKNIQKQKKEDKIYREAQLKKKKKQLYVQKIKENNPNLSEGIIKILDSY